MRISKKHNVDSSRVANFRLNNAHCSYSEENLGCGQVSSKLFWEIGSVLFLFIEKLV